MQMHYYENVKIVNLYWGTTSCPSVLLKPSLRVGKPRLGPGPWTPISGSSARFDVSIYGLLDLICDNMIMLNDNLYEEFQSMDGTAHLLCVHSPGIQTQVGWLLSYGGQRLSERPKLCEKWVAEGGEEAIDGQAKGGGGAIDGLSAWATCPSRASSQAVLEGQLGQEEVQRMQEQRKGGRELGIDEESYLLLHKSKPKVQVVQLNNLFSKHKKWEIFWSNFWFKMSWPKKL